jgi:hypothetical protein
MWKYGRARQATDDNILGHMCFACWMTKATDTHTDYVIPSAFPWQQWLCKYTLVLHLYVHCLSCLIGYAITSSLASGCQPCSVMGFISIFSCSEGELKKLVISQFSS